MSEEMTYKEAIIRIREYSDSSVIRKQNREALRIGISAIEAVERLTEYLNNPNSGENGLVHIDDVRGVMEGYEA